MTGLLIRNCVISGAPSSSVYIEGGRISEISRESELAAPSGCEVIEANGGTLLPGLTDSHCHPFEYGRLKRSLDLRGTGNITGVRLRLQARVQRAEPGEWIFGRGWNQEDFPDRKMPTHADIDDITRSNPTMLSRACGHIALLNSRAIEELGFGSRRGEEFERDGAGNLTGIVKEGAMTEALAGIPKTPGASPSDLQAVEAEAARLGLTTLHCILSPEGFREELAALAAMAGSRTLSLRYRVYLPPGALDLPDPGLGPRLKGDRVRINGVKLFTDGSLGARTAALREPYSDKPETTGMLRYTDEELSVVVEKVDARGLQAIVHAIGDRAVEQAVDSLSRVTGATNPRRHRIEHAGVLPKDLRGRMAKHGIRAAVQPMFVTSDTWAVDRLGEERVRDYYPLRSMTAEGITASGSSDSPVESLSPVLGMWAAMTRGGSVPEESLDLAQALALYTSNAASNGFDEASLSEGAPANLTVLDSDVSGMHPALLRKVGVLSTLVEGAAVHSYGAG
ncbi:MAG: amidohydrolase [Nitrososphaerota archaeon]|nr:amidohydrolase [Nitrososphaerota archaeon]MDG7023333.1 amidohydrolase [Nitrososphaerota archaeon]